MEKLTFQAKDGSTEEFYVIEQARMGGKNYLLVADSKDENSDGECLVLRESSREEEQYSLYETVVDERELEAVLTLFGQLLEDVKIEM